MISVVYDPTEWEQYEPDPKGGFLVPLTWLVKWFWSFFVRR